MIVKVRLVRQDLLPEASRAARSRTPGENLMVSSFSGTLSLLCRLGRPLTLDWVFTPAVAPVQTHRWRLLGVDQDSEAPPPQSWSSACDLITALCQAAVSLARCSGCNSCVITDTEHCFKYEQNKQEVSGLSGEKRANHTEQPGHMTVQNILVVFFPIRGIHQVKLTQTCGVCSHWEHKSSTPLTECASEQHRDLETIVARRRGGRQTGQTSCRKWVYSIYLTSSAVGIVKFFHCSFRLLQNCS